MNTQNKKMTICQKYGIKEDVDFYDIDLKRDNKLFVDPYMIAIARSDLAHKCHNDVVVYFSQLLSFARSNNKEEGYKLVEYLKENNEFRLGYSKDKSRGNGFGEERGRQLFDEIQSSSATKAGVLEDIFDTSVMIKGVGADLISDLTLNIICENLINYTQEQCKRYSIPMELVRLKRPVWSPKANEWVHNYQTMLPVADGKPIIFVPKDFARSTLVYNYTRFYSKGMMEYYENMVMRNHVTSLMRALKQGYKPHRGKIRQAYPCLKDSVIEFIERQPEIYKEYKDKQLKFIRIDRV